MNLNLQSVAHSQHADCEVAHDLFESRLELCCKIKPQREREGVKRMHLLSKQFHSFPVLTH